jgi:hypothetical protein
MAPPTVDSESAAEFVATVRAEHVAMKQWYNSDTVNAELQRIKQQYGATDPDVWKEVLNWPGWKETRKAYLKYTQQQQPQPQHEPPPNTTTTTAPAATVPRKRQSRWGNAASTTATDDATAATKRGRWGVADTAATTPLQLLQQWPALTAAGGAGGTATATTNTQVQQLQAELRALNAKLERVHQEAERVDALPRGHGDRSPSPPPGTLFYTILYYMIHLVYHLNVWFLFCFVSP